MLSEQAIKTGQTVNILPVIIIRQKPVYSIIAPVHNEEAVLPELYQRVSTVMDSLGEPWELILVDDGSSDRSAAIMLTLSEQDDRVKGISRGVHHTSFTNSGDLISNGIRLRFITNWNKQ